MKDVKKKERKGTSEKLYLKAGDRFVKRFRKLSRVKISAFNVEKYRKSNDIHRC